MILTDILQLVQTVSVILAILVAFGTLKGRDSDKTAELTTMAVDIKYIKEKIQGMDSIRDDLTETKASAKSAHKRLDDHLKYDHKKDITERSN